MNRIFIFLLFVPLMQSCQNNPSETVIKGKIENWSHVGTKEIRLCDYGDASLSFGSSPIDSKGNFKIEKLKSPADNLLMPVDSLFGKTSVISDPTAKGLKGSLFDFFINTDQARGEIQHGIACFHFTPGVSFYESYIYVDKDISVTGTGCRRYMYNSLARQDSFICNIQLKSGWNKVIQKIKSSNSFSFGAIISNTYEVTNIEPAGAKWYYQGYYPF